MLLVTMENSSLLKQPEQGPLYQPYYFLQRVTIKDEFCHEMRREME